MWFVSNGTFHNLVTGLSRTIWTPHALRIALFDRQPPDRFKVHSSLSRLEVLPSNCGVSGNRLPSSNICLKCSRLCRSIWFVRYLEKTRSREKSHDPSSWLGPCNTRTIVRIILFCSLFFFFQMSLSIELNDTLSRLERMSDLSFQRKTAIAVVIQTANGKCLARRLSITEKSQNRKSE